LSEAICAVLVYALIVGMMAVIAIKVTDGVSP
jgi:hypothetical protein